MTSACRTEPEVTSITAFTAFFKAFCNATRASIVEQLMSGEKCVCELTAHVGGSQPLVSHHLAVLRDAGFVTMRGQGARTYYAIDWQNFDAQLASFGHTTQLLRAQDAGPSCACG
jgi:ArsR family transcriptional regulator, arsenate/arsenite/antimonite-responsive transcriptional repressor